MRHLVIILSTVGSLVVGQVNFPGGSSRSQSSVSSRISGSDSSCCKPVSACASILLTDAERSRAKCQLPNGSSGLCCSDRNNVGSSRTPFRSADTQNLSRRNSNRVSSSDLPGAIRRGQGSVNNITVLATRFAPPSGAAFYHARFQRQARRETKQQGDSGLLLEQITRQLATASGFSSSGSVRSNGNSGNSDAVNFGQNSQTRQSLDNNVQCPRQSGCSSSRYRSADGSCNNLREGIWGKVDTVLNRVLPPVYSDGVELPKQSTLGGPLPSARLLSTSLASDFNQEDSRFSVILMNFGQFVDHDLAHSPIQRSPNEGDIDCCSSSTSGPDFHSFCLPIDVPFNDRFFRGRRTCMNLVRSLPGPALDCSLRYREQINQLTHWLDLSQVYGSNLNEQREVRSFSGGRLATNSGPDGPILPRDASDNSCRVGVCMKAGDGRVNEQPNLGVLHIIFLREHNRIADGLSSLNPNWSDESVFQEARKILIGKYQHIIYNEWLPIILGNRFMNLYGLLPLTNGYSQDYNPSIDPRITNEFSTAAFRFGHSLIPSLIQVNNRINQENNPSLTLRDTFLKPELLRLPGMLNGLVSGLTRESIQQFDTSFTEDITNHLFDGDRNGMDLVALNIQRGRDHGLPGYTKYRELCGQGSTNSFTDLSRQMNFRRTEELQQLYRTPEDIDLFVGMFSERPMSDALVGPTTLCLVGDQFARLKKGDRFFYDLGGQPGSFSTSQLNEIRKSSLTRLLCDNSGVSSLQPLGFQIPSGFNPVLSCQDFQAIPSPSLQPWGGEVSVRRNG